MGDAVHLGKPKGCSAGPSSRVTNQVRDLVRLQDEMDDLLFKRLSGSGLGALIPKVLTTMGENAIEGVALAQHALPFLNFDSNEHGPALVPVDRILGTSWRWRRLYSKDVRVDEMVTYFTDLARADPKDKDCARLTLVEPFGLYVAHEGKNRVRFLRNAGSEMMAAMVWVQPYPAADRIRLYRSKILGQDVTWAVLDGRQACQLRLPEVTVPLLLAYGIDPVERWPDHWPDPLRVARALEDASGHLCRRTSADIEAIQEDLLLEREEEEFIDASILEMVDVRLRLKWWLGYFSLCAFAGLVLTLFAGVGPGLTAGLVGSMLGLVVVTGKSIRTKAKMTVRSWVRIGE